LCDKVTVKSSLIWNSDWLNLRYKNLIENSLIINNKTIEQMDVGFSKYEIEKLGGFSYR
jgi:hypothetical protein